MRSSAKPFLLSLICALGFFSPLCGKDGAASAKNSAEDDGGKKEDALDIPIPPGHDATGIKLPLYSEDGKLQMTFAIRMAKRVDDVHLQMGALKLETFDENGGLAMSVEMKSSMLDLSTHVITSNDQTTVKRADFEITGNKVEFDTKARRSRFLGPTRMLIYNLE